MSVDHPPPTLPPQTKCLGSSLISSQQKFVLKGQDLEVSGMDICVVVMTLTYSGDDDIVLLQVVCQWT